MPLFRLDNGKASIIGVESLQSEAVLQKLIDDNLETITGVRLLETQYPIPNGRIDTLGIDENNVPVVVEYKFGRDPGAIIQALFYLDWIRNNKRTFDMLTRERLGSNIEVNWASPPRVIVIAKDFDVKELSAVNQMNPTVELKRYSYYGNLIVVDDTTPMRLVKQQTHTENNTIGTTLESPTLESILQPASHEVKDTFWELRDRILALGDDIREVPGQWWVDYRKSSTFVSPSIQKKRLRVLIKMGDKPINDPKGLTSKIDYYGRLNTSIYIKNLDEIDYAMELIKQAYDYVP